MLFGIIGLALLGFQIPLLFLHGLRLSVPHRCVSSHVSHHSSFSS